MTSRSRVFLEVLEYKFSIGMVLVFGFKLIGVIRKWLDVRAEREVRCYPGRCAIAVCWNLFRVIFVFTERFTGNQMLFSAGIADGLGSRQIVDWLD